VLEYAVLIAVALVVIIGGQIYFKRALHGRWKENADQVGEQFTTNQTYTIESRQQSVRRDTTGLLPAQDSTVNAGAWSQSTVRAALPSGMTIAGVDGEEAGYTGHETTRRDFVTQAVGGDALGTHSTFDSGQLSGITLFGDD
jgi:Flp pilus assembly pilin Flp